MALSPHATRPNCGADFKRADKKPIMQLGQVFHGDDGHNWRYCRASVAFAANAPATIADTTFAATAGAGGYTAGAAIPATYCGWFRQTAL